MLVSHSTLLSTMWSTPNESILKGQPFLFENESRSVSKSIFWMDMDSPRKPKNASRPRSSSDINSARLFDEAALNPPKTLPSPEKQPLSPAWSPTIPSERNFFDQIVAQLIPSFKHKVTRPRAEPQFQS